MKSLKSIIFKNRISGDRPLVFKWQILQLNIIVNRDNLLNVSVLLSLHLWNGSGYRTYIGALLRRLVYETFRTVPRQQVSCYYLPLSFFKLISLLNFPEVSLRSFWKALPFWCGSMSVLKLRRIVYGWFLVSLCS